LSREKQVPACSLTGAVTDGGENSGTKLPRYSEYFFMRQYESQRLTGGNCRIKIRRCADNRHKQGFRTRMTDFPAAAAEQTINLKNPFLAGFLAWLVPGLGHYYQGRFAKALLFFFCIVPTFLIGCRLGSSAEAGTARNVYWSWRNADQRFWMIPQGCLGLAAVPAGFHAWQIRSGQKPLLGRVMVPPKLYPGDRSGVEPSMETIQQQLPLFELGTYLTAIAGLMNLLVIFDAADGPMSARRKEKK
jgi:hypothetical protein